MRQYLLAAGNGTLGGLGAQAVYRQLPLTLKEQNYAWVIQQTVTRVSHSSAKEVQQEATMRRAIEMEQQGMLKPYQPPGTPNGLPLDPGRVPTS